MDLLIHKYPCTLSGSSGITGDHTSFSSMLLNFLLYQHLSRMQKIYCCYIIKAGALAIGLVYFFSTLNSSSKVCYFPHI